MTASLRSKIVRAGFAVGVGVGLGPAFEMGLAVVAGVWLDVGDEPPQAAATRSAKRTMAVGFTVAGA
jgi:hypothetical protein